MESTGFGANCLTREFEYCDVSNTNNDTDVNQALLRDGN